MIASREAGSGAEWKSKVNEALAPACGEVDDLGVFWHREWTPVPANGGAFAEVERVLAAAGPVRVFDFNSNHDDPSGNIVPSEGADLRAYEGDLHADAGPVLRVDHHCAIPCLAQQSATPLVLNWLRSLHANNRRDLLASIARSRYIADHADADILLSNHLAARAEDRTYLFGPVADCIAAAALRNDHVTPPKSHVEPFASRIFYACCGLEEALRRREVSFFQAQKFYLAALHGWLCGEPVELELARTLSTWETEERAKEEKALHQFDEWAKEGFLRPVRDRVAYLEAPSKVNNSDFFLWFASDRARRVGFSSPMVQVLRVPAGQDDGVPRYRYKIRSHGGFDLHPLLVALNGRFPKAGFEGRATAAGSEAVPQLDTVALMEEIASATKLPAPDSPSGPP